MVIDFETLDLVPTAKILEIGAVVMDTDSGEASKFFVQVAWEDISQEYRTESIDTIKFWDGVNPNWRTVYSMEHCYSLRRAVNMLHTFMQDNPFDTIWSNGADFDLPILANLFNQFNIPKWNFRKNRCYRTFREEFKEVENKFIGMKHNALDDALNEAIHIAKILKHIEVLKSKGREEECTTA